MPRPVEISYEEQVRLSIAYHKFGSFEKTARALQVPRWRVVRAVYRLQGRCDCGAELPSGYATCAICRKRVKASKISRYHLRKEQGLCVQCGEPRDPPSNTYCARHREQELERARFRRQERIRLGLCPCGAPLDSKDTFYCSRHALQRRKVAFARRNHSKFGGWYGYILDRDGYKCVICQGDKPRLEVHHTRPTNDPEFLFTTCLYCHHALTALSHCKNIAALLEFYNKHSVSC